MYFLILACDKCSVSFHKNTSTNLLSATRYRSEDFDIIMKINDKPPCMCLQSESHEGLKCEAGYWTVCALARHPTLLCFGSTHTFDPVLSLTHSTMQIFCHRGHLGAIKQCVGRA